MVEPAWLGSVSIRKGGWGLCRHCIGDLPAAVWVSGAARVGRRYEKWQAGALLAWSQPIPIPLVVVIRATGHFIGAMFVAVGGGSFMFEFRIWAVFVRCFHRFRSANKPASSVARNE